MGTGHITLWCENIMILHDNGEVVIESENDDLMPSLENSDDGFEYPIKRKLLMTGRGLNF